MTDTYSTKLCLCYMKLTDSFMRSAIWEISESKIKFGKNLGKVKFLTDFAFV